jgi:hypothetical protein
MKTSHRNSTVSILLFAFVALTFIAPGVSSVAQMKGGSYGEKMVSIFSKIEHKAPGAVCLPGLDWSKWRKSGADRCDG